MGHLQPTSTDSESSGPCSASTAQVTLASSSGAYFVPAGSAGISLPQRLCTRLSSLRSAARLAPQRTSATALFDYISAGRSTHCACPKIRVFSEFFSRFEAASRISRVKCAEITGDIPRQPANEIFQNYT